MPAGRGKERIDEAESKSIDGAESPALCIDMKKGSMMAD